MAASTTTRASEPATEPKPGVYVVVSDAVVVPVGKNENGRVKHARVLRGGEVRGPEDSEVISNLVLAGAIKRVANAAELASLRADLADPALSRHRQTARQAALASGAPDDPIAHPVVGAVPVPDGVVPDLPVS